MVSRLVTCLSLVIALPPLAATEFIGKVVSVIDGDTIEVMPEKQRF